ncbi:MAG: FecR domain-containing protein [Cyclobacteriaceae bacterium]
MDKKTIDFELIWKKMNATLTEEEESELNSWLKDKDHQRYFNQVMEQSEGERLPESSIASLPWKKIKRKSNQRNRKVISIVAGIVLILTFVFIGLVPNEQLEQAQVTPNPIVPGSDKAILITSAGESIELSSGVNLDVKEEEVSLRSDGKSIVYTNERNSAEGNIKNTLIIPKGGKFAVSLSDGTRVWINSDSRLEYPIAFSETDRTVTLQGEAYFEVTHDSNRPFTVISKEQKVQVLGTSFSISSYPESEEVLTTLVEGAVKVQCLANLNEEHLTPGRQSKLIKKTNLLTIKDVDTELFVAWKDGWFVFEDQSLGEILETLSRWYNVDIFFVNAQAKGMKFTGEIERHENIENIISLIEKTNAVKIEIKDRTVIVR